MYSYEKLSVNPQPRVAGALAIVLATFFVLTARLWFLQVIRGEHFKELSENNRVRTVFIPPPRGEMQDRNGIVLVKNRPSFNVELSMTDVRDLDQVLARLAQIVDLPVESLKERVEKQPAPRFRPRILMRDIPRDLVAQIVSRQSELPGIRIQPLPLRWYIHGDFAAHVVGHIREISRKELSQPRYQPYYRAGDLIGKFGLEMQWEHYLQGRRGTREIVVNVHGSKIREFPPRERAYPGNTLQLTLDYHIQKRADEVMQDKKGAVVALDPNTGDVLALSSAPRFDPNIFTGELSEKEWASLVAGPERPLNNRAVQGTYPPGSVFKMIMGVAGLAEKVVSNETTAYCPGFHRFGNRTYHCHKRTGHGTVDLIEALMVSCDVYFYILGQRLGVNRIHEYATRFGLGTPTGLELVHEASGLVPSTEWKKRRYAGTEEARWFPGETLSVAIGQGATTSTPLQIAVAMAALVNGGKVLKPRLVQGVLSASGEVRDNSFGVDVVRNVEVDSSVLAVVRKGMEEVVQNIKGTGKRARLPEEWGISVAGKTGTSQVVSLDRKGDDSRFEHHAWFVGYAPAEKPEIVVAALLENAGHGGVAAAPVVQQVLSSYFETTRGLEVNNDAL